MGCRIVVSIKLMTHQAPTCLSIRPREWFLHSGLVAKSQGGVGQNLWPPGGVLRGVTLHKPKIFML